MVCIFSLTSLFGTCVRVVPLKILYYSSSLVIASLVVVSPSSWCHSEVDTVTVKLYASSPVLVIRKDVV